MAYKAKNVTGNKNSSAQVLAVGERLGVDAGGPLGRAVGSAERREEGAQRGHTGK